MGPWPPFGDAVVPMVQALMDLRTLSANNKDIGDGWQLVKQSATLLAVENAVKAYILAMAPDFQLPLGWAEGRLPMHLDQLLRDLYTRK
jgi:hypothetical protein